MNVYFLVYSYLFIAMYFQISPVISDQRWLDWEACDWDIVGYTQYT